MKRIIFIDPGFSKQISGIGTHSRYFYNEFIKNGSFRISKVFTIETKKISSNAEFQDGIVNLSAKIPHTKKILNASLSGDFRRDAESISSELSDQKNILFFNDPSWVPVLPFINSLEEKALVVVRSGGNDLAAGWIGNNSESVKRSKRQMIEIINKHVDYLVVNSSFSFRRMVSFGVLRKKIIIVRGGVDSSSFAGLKRMKRKQLTIITVSRLVKFKGFEYNLQVMRNVLSHTKQVRYLIVGDGPEMKNIQDEIDSSLKKHVKLVGCVPVEEVSKYLSQADIFLHLPYNLRKCSGTNSFVQTETMGRSLCEALAASIPVVSTRIGGIPEIINEDYNGFLVSEKDVFAATSKLLFLIEDEGKRIEMSKNARIFAERFLGWDVVFKKYNSLFKSIN